MTVIDDYLKKIDPQKRKELERIRKIAKKIVPDAQEKIGYGMPTLTSMGQAFLGFDAHKNHIGIYPYSGHVTEILKDKLSPYEFSSGAIRVPYNNLISESLLKQIITCRLEQIKEQNKSY